MANPNPKSSVRADPDTSPSSRPSATSPGADPCTSSPSPPATLLQVLGAVFWSFFGVRKGKAMQRDAVSIRPHQVIIVGILIAAVLVASLLMLVRFITRTA